MRILATQHKDNLKGLSGVATKPCKSLDNLEFYLFIYLLWKEAIEALSIKKRNYKKNI